LEADDQAGVERAISIILLLHGMILSFGGIPLLYYGDELGTLNDYSFLEDPGRADDSRWMNRPAIDWERAERRNRHGSAEQRIFDGLKHAIAVRKTIPAFADFNNRDLIATSNPHLFAFWRTDPGYSDGAVLVVANFDGAAQRLDLDDLGNRGMYQYGDGVDLLSGEVPAHGDGHLVIPAYGFYWLSDQRSALTPHG
jgi:amylosucrase